MLTHRIQHLSQSALQKVECSQKFRPKMCCVLTKYFKNFRLQKKNTKWLCSQQKCNLSNIFAIVVKIFIVLFCVCAFVLTPVVFDSLSNTKTDQFFRWFFRSKFPFLSFFSSYRDFFFIIYTTAGVGSHSVVILLSYG
jgi:hypothetical protein